MILASDAVCAFACCLLRAFLVSTPRLDRCSWLCSFNSWVLGSLPWLFLFCVRSCLHCPVRGTDVATQRAPLTLCEAWFSRASRPTSRTSSSRSCTVSWVSAVEVTWLYGPISSRLLLVARLRLLALAAVDQVPRGQPAPLDHFRTLLIDQSAELVESLPVHGRPWRRPLCSRVFLVGAHFRLIPSVSRGSPQSFHCRFSLSRVTPPCSRCLLPLATHRLQLPVGNRGTDGLPDLHLL